MKDSEDYYYEYSSTDSTWKPFSGKPVDKTAADTQAAATEIQAAEGNQPVKGTVD